MSQNSAVAAVLLTYSELEKTHGSAFAAAFISEHCESVWRALDAILAARLQEQRGTGGSGGRYEV